MIKWTFLVFLFLHIQGILLGYPSLPEAQFEEEALWVRRILVFWKDREYPLAKSQIHAFLKENPESAFSDHFWAMLGDIALQNKAFKEAAGFYEKISKEDIKMAVQHKKWHSLYQLGLFSQLYQEIAPQQSCLDEQGIFYFAESAFREAMALLRYPEGREEAQNLCREALPFFETLIENDVFASHSKLAMAEIFLILKQPEKAALIFKKLARQKWEKNADAAFQWLLLLAEAEDWETIAYERELFTSTLAAEHLPICYFYLGVISYQKKLFHQAVLDLKKCIGQNLPAPQEKKALLTLLASASEVDQWELIETCYEQTCISFPETRAEASYLLAAAYQKGGEIYRALKIYEKIAQDFPTTEFAEIAQAEKIRMLAQQKNFKDAHDSLSDFLKAYPKSNRKTEMIRFAITLSLTQLAEESVYEQLVADLERGLEANVFYKDEKTEKQTLLAKAYLKLGRATEALQLLQTMGNPDPQLLAYCYMEGKAAPEKIVEYGEKALAIHPQDFQLHLHLFNAYAALAQENQATGLIQQAAAHLLAACDHMPISLENRIWLAHYYADENPERAIPILESILSSEINLKKYDHEALLLATLYTSCKRESDACHLLERVISLHQKTEGLAKLQLAETYALQGQKDKAIALYEKLEEYAQPGIADRARLKVACLDFASAPEKNLKKLSDLAARKSLGSEPLHLEASLEYAELKASLYPEDEKTSALLKFLEEIKVSFTSQSDAGSKKYHANRKGHPEKDLVYQAYMRYLDARIFLLQAKLALDPAEIKLKQNTANALLSTLRHGKYSVTPYIKAKSIALAGHYD